MCYACSLLRQWLSIADGRLRLFNLDLWNLTSFAQKRRVGDTSFTAPGLSCEFRPCSRLQVFLALSRIPCCHLPDTTNTTDSTAPHSV
jgi:hypothetical protein